MPSGMGEPHSYGATEGAPFQSYVSGQEAGSRPETQCLGSGQPANTQQLDKHYQSKGNLISP